MTPGPRIEPGEEGEVGKPSLLVSVLREQL
jgi:hypothetical protein